MLYDIVHEKPFVTEVRTDYGYLVGWVVTYNDGLFVPCPYAGVMSNADPAGSSFCVLNLDDALDKADMYHEDGDNTWAPDTGDPCMHREFKDAVIGLLGVLKSDDTQAKDRGEVEPYLRGELAKNPAYYEWDEGPGKRPGQPPSINARRIDSWGPRLHRDALLARANELYPAGGEKHRELVELANLLYPLPMPAEL